MSFFAEVNQDAVSVPAENVSRGPRVGFQKAFETSYNVQTRGAAMFGIQEAMRDREDKQRQALRKAGVENIPSLSQQADDPLRMFTDFGQDYIDTARFYQDGGDPKMAARLEDYDKRVEELRTKYPDLGLETSGEMWQSVRTKAQEYESRQQTERRDFGGAIGDLAGSALGALNPNTDPLNVATLPVGGAGKSAVVRIAGQAGAQGLVEGANQLLGVQEQRRLLGLDYGTVDALTRVGGAVVGGAAIQSVGEAIGFGVRRFFTPTKADPLPPVPPQPQPLPDARTVPDGVIPDDLNVAAGVLVQRPKAYTDFMQEVNPMRGTRVGKARFMDDVDHMDNELTSWENQRPWEVAPKTDTATRTNLNDFTRAPDFSVASERASIDAIARRVDPQTMSRYDTLADEKARLRAQIDGLSAERDIGSTNPRFEELSAELYRVNDKAARASAKNRKKLKAQRDTIVAEMEQLYGQLEATDSPAMAETRAKLVAVDEAMRDLAEPVSRAYGRARGKWSATEAEREAVMEMMRQGNRTVGPTPESDAFIDTVARTIEQDIPMLLDRPPELKADADAVDVVRAVIAKREEALVEQDEAWMAKAKQIVSDAEKFDELDAKGKEAAREKAAEESKLPPGEFAVEGFDETININDRITVVDDNGEARVVTVREMLQEQVERQEDLQAVQSCSLR